MFASSNLKLYRKFLILAVLVGSLMATLQPVQPASAAMICEPPHYLYCCCSWCPGLVGACTDDCNNLYPTDPLAANLCYWANCEPISMACSHCDAFC